MPAKPMQLNPLRALGARGFAAARSRTFGFELELRRGHWL